MIGKKIPVVFRIMFVIWVILQVCLVIKYWDMPNHDDAQAYVKLASECIARGTWYPDVHNQYEDFIFGPGYVNLLIGIYHLCGSFSFVRLLNILQWYLKYGSWPDGCFRIKRGITLLFYIC